MDPANPYSASEQALGYMYQGRLALKRILELPESTSVLMEKEDDVEFQDPIQGRTLASLKHKGIGDRLTDLSVDFWKSVRIWIERYQMTGGLASDLTFFLFTTAEVEQDSFMGSFLISANNNEKLTPKADAILKRSKSKTIIPIRSKFDELSPDEKEDLLSRITVFSHSTRIDDIPKKIQDGMRTVPREMREAVYQRLEGWWTNLTIDLLTGKRKDAIHGRDVSDKLADIADQFKVGNLPIDFRGKEPVDEVDPDNDPRLFVIQLRELGVRRERIQNAMLDYYRAFEQRASWTREHLLVEGELENYEDLLTNEWKRTREIIFDNLSSHSSDFELLAAAKELLKWAELTNGANLRIRPSVTESYITAGSFHILANLRPVPRVYWHPDFLSQLANFQQPPNS